MASNIDLSTFLKHDDPELIYDLLGEIGQGSFGAVYKAKNKVTGGIVAIKKMQHNGDPNSEEWMEIMKEIRFISLLDHENTIKHYGSYLKGYTIWMVMEFCLGSCADMLEVFKKPLSELEIAAIICKVLCALKYLHDNKRIHRDIKAANILLTSQGKVKLGDFGTASMSDPANTFVGTPCWMAPEVILAMESGLYTSRADIWSLGITCIELAEKKPPLFEMNTMSALYHIPQNEPPGLAEPNSWSPDFVDFVKKCLQKNYNHRPTADQLLQHPFVSGDPKQHSKVLRALVRRSKQAAAELDDETAKKMEKLVTAELEPSTRESEDDAASNKHVLSSPPPAKEPAAIVHLDITKPEIQKPASNRSSTSSSPANSQPSENTPTKSSMRRRDSDDGVNLNDFKDHHSEKTEVNMDGTTIKPQRRDVESDQQKQNAKDIIKGQLKLFKQLQTKQQIQTKQLEKTNEQHRLEMRRVHEREWESELKVQTAEIEKIIQRNKQLIQDTQKTQAQALKAFERDQKNRYKQATKDHQSNLKRVMSEMEKNQKEQRHKLPKGSEQRRIMKEANIKELATYKESSETRFHAEQKLLLHNELKAFKTKQQEDFHALEMRLFTEEFEKKRLHKEQQKSRRLAHFDIEHKQLLDHQKELHTLQLTHQSKQQELETSELRAQQDKEEKDLKKLHLTQLKKQPQAVKSIQTTLKKELTNTVKQTRARHSVRSKQLLETAPRDMHKRILEDQKAQLEKELALTEKEFSKKTNETIERETFQLNAAQTKREEELLVSHTKSRADLTGFQKLRRDALLSSQSNENEATLKKQAEQRAALERTLDTDFDLFVDNYADQRGQLHARQAREKIILAEQLMASSPPSLDNVTDSEDDISVS